MPLPNRSVENLVHFSCPYCQKWWSVGDAPEDKEVWWCTWCGGRWDKYESQESVDAWLKPFQKKEIAKSIWCPKCGNNDLHKRYRKPGDKLDERWEPNFEQAKEELIRICCRSCGYRWNSPVLEKITTFMK